VIAEGVLADELGVEAITLGEHHRDDFAVSAPETVLAAIAAKTDRIILSSGVTVLSSDDPVRVFQRFATLDAVSRGRAEIIMGRGSFTESFPLFGYQLEDYQMLFEEKLNLFSEIRKEQPVTWSGNHRAPLVHQEIYPKSHSGSIRTWVGVGEALSRSCERQVMVSLSCWPLLAERPTGLHRMLICITALSSRRANLRNRWAFTHPDTLLPRTKRRLSKCGLPTTPCLAVLAANVVGHRRRRTTTLTKSTTGQLCVGSPETVATKIANTVQALGIRTL